MIEHETFVELMSGVCAPVTVVTAMTADGEPHGSTVSSFASLSLDPPLLSFSLDRAVQGAAVGAGYDVGVLAA